MTRCSVCNKKEDLGELYENLNTKEINKVCGDCCSEIQDICGRLFDTRLEYELQKLKKKRWKNLKEWRNKK